MVYSIISNGAAEGLATGRGIRFLCLSPPTSGQARMGRRGSAQLDAEFSCFSCPSPPTSGLACSVALPWLEFAFLSFTHWPLDGRPS